MTTYCESKEEWGFDHCREPNGSDYQCDTCRRKYRKGLALPRYPMPTIPMQASYNKSPSGNRWSVLTPYCTGYLVLWDSSPNR